MSVCHPRAIDGRGCQSRPSGELIRLDVEFEDDGGLSDVGGLGECGGNLIVFHVRVEGSAEVRGVSNVEANPIRDGHVKWKLNVVGSEFGRGSEM